MRDARKAKYRLGVSSASPGRRGVARRGEARRAAWPMARSAPIFAKRAASVVIGAAPKWRLFGGRTQRSSIFCQSWLNGFCSAGHHCLLNIICCYMLYTWTHGRLHERLGMGGRAGERRAAALRAWQLRGIVSLPSHVASIFHAPMRATADARVRRNSSPQHRHRLLLVAAGQARMA